MPCLKVETIRDERTCWQSVDVLHWTNDTAGLDCAGCENLGDKCNCFSEHWERQPPPVLYKGDTVAIEELMHHPVESYTARQARIIAATGA